MDKVQSKMPHISGLTVINFIVYILFMVMLGVFVYQGSLVFDKVKTNWQEITFAYNHPNLIQDIREDYASKSAQLDGSYAEKEQKPTPEQEALQKLNAMLDSNPSKSSN